MKKLQIVCYVIGVSQLALGGLYLFAPAFFIAWQELGPITADMGYPLAMLAGRFLVYGVGMFVIARAPEKNAFWLDGMIAIQVVDLAAGLFYVATGIVPLSSAMVPMFNATLFTVLMLWVRPATTGEVVSA
ncbi:MAG: hypothetical protein JKY41_09810 [Rhodobacteraceae bacterium]|nr:hypothetical protein [Paracoccaceae bacterium]